MKPPETVDRDPATSDPQPDPSAALREERHRLDNERRRLSRLIGEHKKAGQPFDALLTEMKNVSQQLRDIDGRLAALSAAPAADTAAETEQQTSASETDIDPESFTVVRADDDSWRQKWNAFVATQAGASVYHRYEFKALIENDFGQRCIYLAAVGTDGGVLGVLPAAQLHSRLFGNYVVSVPYFNYGGALSRAPNVAARLIEGLIEEARGLGARHVELRDTAPHPEFPAKTEKVAMLLDLPSSSDRLWQNIGSKVRAQIKAAQNHELRPVFGSAELLDDFYRVFAHNMRDLGTPVYARRIFAALLSRLGSAAVLAVVYHGRSPVSCAFLLGYRGRLEIPWASTLRSANRLNANMFLYWHVLRFAIEQGYTSFDFGRSSKNAGTYKFKKQWGAKPQQLYWHYWLAAGEQLPQMNPNNPKYRLLIAVWRRLPVFVTRLIGPPIVRNLP